MSDDTIYVQHVTAPNDRNGNPRRLYLVTSASAESTVAIDEGYGGRQLALAHIRAPARVIDLPTVNVGAAEYRRLLRVLPGPEHWWRAESI